MLCILFATLYDAINFYCMSLLYIMGKNIINNKMIFIQARLDPFLPIDIPLIPPSCSL